MLGDNLSDAQKVSRWDSCSSGSVIWMLSSLISVPERQSDAEHPLKGGAYQCAQRHSCAGNPWHAKDMLLSNGLSASQKDDSMADLRIRADSVPKAQIQSNCMPVLCDRIRRSALAGVHKYCRRDLIV